MKYIQAKVSDEVHKEIKKWAVECGMTLPDAIILLLTAGMKATIIPKM